MGAECTMLGEWPDEQVVLIARNDYETKEDLPLNQHKLQPPFHKFEIRGDVLLMKLDGESNPVDYSKESYEAYSKLELPEWTLDEIEESEDDESDGDLFDHVLSQLVDKFKTEHSGRNPTQQELNALIAEAENMVDEMEGNPDNEDDDSGDEDEEDEDFTEGSDDDDE